MIEIQGTKKRPSITRVALASWSRLAPFVATALLGIFGHVSWPISVYIIIMAIITFVSAYLAGETRTIGVIATDSAAVEARVGG